MADPYANATKDVRAATPKQSRAQDMPGSGNYGRTVTIGSPAQIARSLPRNNRRTTRRGGR